MCYRYFQLVSSKLKAPVACQAPQSMGILQARILEWVSMPSSSGASWVAQLVKNLLAMQETQKTQVRSLGGEDPLEEEMATLSSILAWRIPMD